VERAIDAVLFDFGGVLIGSPFAAIGAVGEAGGHDAAEVLEAMMGDYATDTDHPWHRLERGEIGVAEYGEFVRRQLAERGMELDFSALARLYRDLGIHHDVVDAARRLRARGYRTALVTNNVREFGDSWRALVPLDELFDVVVDSSEVGMRKPNPAIYHHALELLGGVAPERAVFLDDAPGNVAGARAAGLHAILVEDPAAALAELDALLAG
jgi:putative hydrolase of the HAD superfamily